MHADESLSLLEELDHTATDLKVRTGRGIWQLGVACHTPCHAAFYAKTFMHGCVQLAGISDVQKEEDAVLNAQMSEHDQVGIYFVAVNTFMYMSLSRVLAMPTLACMMPCSSDVCRVAVVSLVAALSSFSWSCLLCLTLSIGSICLTF